MFWTSREYGFLGSQNGFKFDNTNQAGQSCLYCVTKNTTLSFLPGRVTREKLEGGGLLVRFA